MKIIGGVEMKIKVEEKFKNMIEFMEKAEGLGFPIDLFTHPSIGNEDKLTGFCLYMMQEINSDRGIAILTSGGATWPTRKIMSSIRFTRDRLFNQLEKEWSIQTYGPDVDYEDEDYGAFGEVEKELKEKVNKRLPEEFAMEIFKEYILPWKEQEKYENQFYVFRDECGKIKTVDPCEIVVKGPMDQILFTGYY